jgi:hypothetical protein
MFEIGARPESTLVTGEDDNLRLGVCTIASSARSSASSNSGPMLLRVAGRFSCSRTTPSLRRTRSGSVLIAWLRPSARETSAIALVGDLLLSPGSG